MITKTPKNFDIVDSDNSLKSVNIKELTLKEREALFLKFEENIKNRRRKEYLEMSKMMDGKDKTKYLVECANANKVTSEEVVEESQTFNGIVEILKITADKQLDWLAILSDENKILPILKAYYYSLGIDIPDVDPDEAEKPVETVAQGDLPKQGDTFRD